LHEASAVSTTNEFDDVLDRMAQFLVSTNGIDRKMFDFIVRVAADKPHPESPRWGLFVEAVAVAKADLEMREAEKELRWTPFD
jgi:hypothetical protein